MSDWSVHPVTENVGTTYTLFNQTALIAVDVDSNSWRSVDLETGKVNWDLTLPPLNQDVAPRFDDHKLLVGTEDQFIKVYNMKDGTEFGTYQIEQNVLEKAWGFFTIGPNICVMAADEFTLCKQWVKPVIKVEEWPNY